MQAKKEIPLLIKKIIQKIKDLDNNKISYNKKYEGIDLNTVAKTEVGDFNIYCTNKPWTESAGGYLITIVISSTYAVQIAINASNGDNYQRLKSSGIWLEWVKK